MKVDEYKYGDGQTKNNTATKDNSDFPHVYKLE